MDLFGRAELGPRACHVRFARRRSLSSVAKSKKGPKKWHKRKEEGGKESSAAELRSVHSAAGCGADVGLVLSKGFEREVVLFWLS